MNIDAATLKWVGEKLGVPTLFGLLLLAMLHFDFAKPMQDGIKAMTDSQKESVQRLTSIENSQRGMEYDIRYGTWRVAPTPPEGVVPEVAPLPPTPKKSK